MNRLSLLINVLNHITTIYTLSEAVNYYTNKAINIFTSDFKEVKKEIDNFSMDNIAEVYVANFSNLNNYDYYNQGDFVNHYGHVVKYLSKIGAKQAIDDFPAIVAPVIQDREEKAKQQQELQDNNARYLY